MSTPPRPLAKASIAAAMPAASAISAGCANTDPADLSRASLAADSVSALASKSTKPTRAPSCRNRLAVAYPMPRAAPVIMAVRPCRRSLMSAAHVSGNDGSWCLASDSSRSYSLFREAAQLGHPRHLLCLALDEAIELLGL